jgi:hypothetical protein
MEELNEKQIKKKKPESQINHETPITIISERIQREICFLTSILKSRLKNNGKNSEGNWTYLRRLTKSLLRNISFKKAE